MFSILWFLLIGAAAGWLAGQLTRGDGFGLVGNLVVGVIGAVVGGLMMSLIGLHASNLIGRLVSATAGAVVALYAIGWLKRNGKI
ncbi:MAG: GlsB/YeaQ/YmgE family stress response membrane protein [Planctomycetota bacterium]